MTYRASQKGAALIIVMVLFVVTSLAISLGLVAPVLRSVKSAKNDIEAKKSYTFAESGVEDVLYRLRKSKKVSATETLVLGNETTTTTVTDISGGGKQISALGNSTNRNRNVTATVTQGIGVSFNYGVQVGRGGFSMTGSSGINGNVYVNGNIVGNSSSFISGSAIAANSEALTADSSNGVTGTPSNTITFGNATATEDLAQSFTVSAETPLNKAQFYIKKTGAPSNATVWIVADNAGSPGTTTLASGTLSASLVTTAYGWVDVTFGTNPTLQTGTTYWLVIDPAASSTNYYVAAANTTYASAAKIGKLNSTWSATSPSTASPYFKIYLGGLTSSISGTDQYNQLRIGTSGSGTASAATINYTQAPGNLYCQAGTGNNKACNTTQSVPTPQAWPISDANIDAWETEALAGGTSGSNTNVGSGYQTVSMGPQKINGDLSIGGSATLYVTGTLWITGNLTVNGAGSMKLAAAYGSGSGVIIVDGRVTIAGSSPVTGSGTAGSYIMIVTNSDCPTSSTCGSNNAIDISGAAGAVVLIAQNGTINFSGSASAKEATGYKITLSGATTVNYETGLADLNFSSGPSGSWSVASWKETQ